jgi:hypothetical protein
VVVVRKGAEVKKVKGEKRRGVFTVFGRTHRLAPTNFLRVLAVQSFVTKGV